MIQHLKIGATDVLSEIKLLSLGKVNVICGRNNSGKTTTLEAINSKENLFLGREFDEATIEVLVSAWDKYAADYSFGVNGPSGTQRLIFGEFTSVLPIREIFQELAVSAKVWFFNDLQLLKEKFWDLFYEKIEVTETVGLSEKNRRKIFTLQRHIQHDYTQQQWKELIDQIFRSIFTESFFPNKIGDLIFVKPKRVILENDNLNSPPNIGADGKNTIPALFHSQSKLAGSSLHKFSQDVKNAFKEVSREYEFGIQTDDQQNLEFFFSLVDKEDWIEAKKSGLGLQDLLIILSFALQTETPIILLEEPENHLHPDMQRKLLRYLAEKTADDKQFFITTHSNIFLNNTYVDQIFFTKFDNGKITVRNETKLSEIFHDLGYSVTDNLVSDLLILVEGPHDVPVIEEFLRELEIDAQFNVKTWALGGDIMDQQDLSVFAERYKVMALVDNDPGSEPVRQKFVAKCEALQIPVTRLEKYAIENYFSVQALKNVFKGQIEDTFLEIDPATKLSDQIKMDVKKNNRKLAKETKIAGIEGTDLRAFFVNVENTLQNL